MHRTEELMRSKQRLRDLATELTLTEQRERRRLAGELHDYLAQLLVVVRMKLRQAASHISEIKTTALLKEADQAISESLNYTRSLVAELAPPALQEFGLLEGFGWLAEQMQPHGLSVSVVTNVPRVDLADDQAVLVFQSARELLFNVLKHAGVGEAELLVERQGDGELAITVIDRGKGFDPSTLTGIGDDSKRFGIFSVRERMEAIGGRLILQSTRHEGTRATLLFPYWPAQAACSKRSDEAAEGIGIASPATAGSEDAAELSGLGTLPPLSEPRTPQNQPLRIVLADNHAMMRQGLHSILSGYSDVSIVGEAADGEEAVELARLLQPDVIVMDINLPKLDGIEATRRIKAEWPGILIVGLSIANASQVEPLLLQAGGSCYVAKDAAGDQLYKAIKAAVKGEVTPDRV
jgi:CheY-like chemotaxis protein